MSIAVIGLGYVGLPLSLQFARSGVTVLGLDVDPVKVDQLRQRKTYIQHIPSTEIAALVANGTFSASTDFSRIREVEAVIICVPTPLGENRQPDISYILNTGRAIAPYLASPEPLLSASTGERIKGGVSKSDARTSDSGSLVVPSSSGPVAPVPTSVPTRPPSGSPVVQSSSRPASGFSAFPKLVVLESTTYPGTTEEDLKNVLEEYSGAPTSDVRPLTSAPTPSSSSPSSGGPAVVRRLLAGIDFHLAFSPEREDPGNPNSKVADIPKIVGGYTPECLKRAVELYSRAIKTVIPVSSCRVAEATKLLENIFRSVNIALVNELKLVYAAMGIDIWEVINAAKTKPFGFMPFYPGPGLGGHCIPIDPFYLSWKARQCGKETRFIELAGEINTAMPEHVVARVAEALRASKDSVSASVKAPSLASEAGGEGRGEEARENFSVSAFQHFSISGAKVLLLGLAYKPNVDDDRESPTYVLMDLLKARGAEVAYYDPFVPVIRPSREHSHWAGVRSVEWTEQTISSFDAVLISTAHADVNYRQLADWSPCIIDTRNIMANVPTKPGQVWKA